MELCPGHGAVPGRGAAHAWYLLLQQNCVFLRLQRKILGFNSLLARLYCLPCTSASHRNQR